MATNLQVNAQTQQAVGAFNALQASIAGARGGFNQLTSTVATGTSTFARYASTGIGSVVSGFDKLTSIVSHSITIITALGAGIEFVFTAIVHELDKIQGFNAIMSVSEGTAQGAADAYDFLRTTANKLGVQFDALTANYAKLNAAIPESANKLGTVQKVFLGIAEAARTLHSSNQDTQLMFYAVTQIASKGVVSMEELRRQLGEKLPGAIQIAARSVNTTVAELVKAISKGTVDSAKFLEAFGDELIRTFAGSAEKASGSVSASINRLTNVWVDFVKEILDSGAGTAIIGVFDALREKLSDPYLIARFADLVKYLAERFTAFIQNLTQDDIRNGFDTFTHAVEASVTVVGELIKLFTWIINNGTKVGAILGGVVGAVVGARAGIIGVGIGAAAGAAAGGYAGSKLSSSPEELAQRKAADLTATADSKAKYAKSLDIKAQILDMVSELKSLKSLDQLNPLLKQDMLTQKTLETVADILTNPKYKTDQQKTDAVLGFAKYGLEIPGKSTTQLKDVLGGNAKKDPEIKRLQNTENRGFGLDANFYDEWNRLVTLFKSGRIDLDELTAAQKRLLNGQPVVAEYNKSIAAGNVENEKALDLLVKQITVKGKVIRDLDDEVRLAGLRNDELFIEQGLTKAQNELADAGIPQKEIDKLLPSLREKLQLVKDTRDITAAENSILDQTVDKYKAQLVQQKALSALVKDPSSGMTAQTATDFTVKQDPNFSGTPQWIDAQKNALEDYYAFINGLRNNDRISEESANQAKSAALVNYTKQLTAAYVQAAQTRLEASSTDPIDFMIASLGRLAVGFTTLTAGAATAFGTFFQSFTDGFANSVGRAIVYSENLGDALMNVAREAVSSLIGALVKLGVQWVVNAVLGKSIAAASAATGTAISVAAAATTAAAWAPAAAMVSLATFGANSIPATEGIVTTVGISELLAAFSFGKGGYTGDKPEDQIAGLVHGKEFVLNSEATAAHRPTLEAMNSGARLKSISPDDLDDRVKTKNLLTLSSYGAGGFTGGSRSNIVGVVHGEEFVVNADATAQNRQTLESINQGNGSNGQGVHVEIYDYGTKKTYEVQQLDESRVRVIARDEADQAVQEKAPGVIAGDLSNPNSRTSKAIQRNTKAERKR